LRFLSVRFDAASVETATGWPQRSVLLSADAIDAAGQSIQAIRQVARVS